MKYAFVDAQDNILSTGFTNISSANDPIPEGAEQVHVIDGHVHAGDPSLYQMVRHDIVREDGKLTERFTKEWLPLEDVKSEFKRRLVDDYQIFVDGSWPVPDQETKLCLEKFTNGEIPWTDIPNAVSRIDSFLRAFNAVNNQEMRTRNNTVLPSALSKISEAATQDDVKKIYDEFDPVGIDVADLPCEDCLKFRCEFFNIFSKEVKKPTPTEPGDDNFNALAVLNNIWANLGRECATEELQNLIRIFDIETVKSEEPVTEDFGDSLLFARQDFGVHLGADVKETALDKIQAAVHGFWTPIDRTGTLPTSGLKVSCDPIPDATGFDKSFELVMLERAKAVWEANDGPIAVSWSGGIDSTGALVALLKTARQGDLDRLTVQYTSGFGLSSVTEYPHFFANFIDEKLNKQEIHFDSMRLNNGPIQMFDAAIRNRLAEVAENSLLVTGEFGDQLFGSAAFAMHPERISMSSAEFLEHSDRIFYKPYMDEIRAFNEKSPIDTTNLVDMLWWWNFAVKWNEIAFRSTIAAKESSTLKNFHHFYQHEDFQKWSINNPHLKVGKTAESYKFTLKDFIYDYTKDADYRDKKTKVGSLRVRIGRVAAIDNKFNIIKFGNTSIDPDLMRQKYGDSLQRFVK